MIVNEAQLQMAKRTGIIVDDTAVDDAIQNMAKHNQMTVTQLREALKTMALTLNISRKYPPTNHDVKVTTTRCDE